jgi:hypothetical protein
MDLNLPINWNEDEVPLDEKDVERKWLDWGKKSGFYATHIENIGSSMPDGLMIWKGVVFFHEVKIQRGNLIYLQQYQWANFATMRHHCHTWQLNIVVWKDGIFNLYSIDQLKQIEAEPAGHGKVKFKISLLQPLISVADSNEFENIYLEWLRSKIWKKKT